ncbi:GntR family transcriptional regulator [Streptomyces antnestii]|uniref:GntR family transcriptional regulator n=1 Tax=Streptomyces antnestii TaxID=2494256 RepID=A0A3S3UEH7_9ACTN|nr:GntR family transcriptional regulator [Streptomyces sp. San01]RVU22246.1 GntR family transcriptional regulator [Streptomyces sp. San01]
MTQAQTRGAAPLTGTVWLRDQVCEGIRDQIITGRLKPGDRLVERDVAEEFGVSRIPVREAIRILMSEGFLQALSPRRIVVKELSRQDVVNLFDMREALEVLAARRAAENADAAQLRTMKRLLETARKATLAGRPERISHANTAFHHHIVETAGNELLAATLEPLEGRLHWLFHQIDDAGSVYEEHRRLYETIAAADAEAAAACALTHVRHYREVALRLLFDEADSMRSADSAPARP